MVDFDFPKKLAHQKVSVKRSMAFEFKNVSGPFRVLFHKLPPTYHFEASFCIKIAFSVTSIHNDKFQVILVDEAVFSYWRHKRKAEIQAINNDNWRDKNSHPRAFEHIGVEQGSRRYYLVLRNRNACERAFLVVNFSCRQVEPEEVPRPTSRRVSQQVEPPLPLDIERKPSPQASGRESNKTEVIREKESQSRSEPEEVAEGDYVAMKEYEVKPSEVDADEGDETSSSENSSEEGSGSEDLVQTTALIESPRRGRGHEAKRESESERERDIETPSSSDDYSESSTGSSEESSGRSRSDSTSSTASRSSASTSSKSSPSESRESTERVQGVYKENVEETADLEKEPTVLAAFDRVDPEEELRMASVGEPAKEIEKLREDKERDERKRFKEEVEEKELYFRSIYDDQVDPYDAEAASRILLHEGERRSPPRSAEDKLRDEGIRRLQNERAIDAEQRRSSQDRSPQGSRGSSLSVSDSPDYMAQLQSSTEVVNDWDQRRQIAHDQLDLATSPGGFITPP